MSGTSGLMHAKLDFKDTRKKAMRNFYPWSVYSSAGMLMQIAQMTAYFQ